MLHGDCYVLTVPYDYCLMLSFCRSDYTLTLRPVIAYCESLLCCRERPADVESWPNGHHCYITIALSTEAFTVTCEM